MIVNKRQLSDILGVSERTLTEWQQSNMPIKSVGGQGHDNAYCTVAVIDWRIQRALNGVTVESARERRDRLEADLLELKLAKERGDLVPADLILPTWEHAVLATRASLRALPERIKSHLEGRHGITVDLVELLDMVDEALSKLTESPPAGPVDVTETTDPSVSEEAEA